MKFRILGIIFMVIITVPIMIIGRLPFKILTILISLLGLKEFLGVKKNLPKFIEITSYILMILLNLYQFSLDTYKVFSYIVLVFLVFVIYYHNDKKYSIFDAIYVIIGIFILYLTCNCVIDLRASNVNILIYLILITTMTDTYAYIVGCLIGKHKLIEEISPKKTVEGLIGGVFGGVLISVIFYVTMFDEVNILLLVFQTITLSLLGQFGDLLFSVIKRQHKIKDFSNLIPGHGGILDRIDSLIFVTLGYLIFI